MKILLFAIWAWGKKHAKKYLLGVKLVLWITFLKSFISSDGFEKLEQLFEL
jgi:hypothetical protein